MDVNPYESPREAGYTPPIDQRFREWINDRIALVLTGLVVQTVAVGGALLYAWLSDSR